MVPVVHSMTPACSALWDQLLMVVQHVIPVIILLGIETIVYLCQRSLSRVQRYSNVRSAECCVLVLALLFLFKISKHYCCYNVFFAETIILLI